MRLGTQMALAAGLGLSCAVGNATTYVTRAEREADEECLARWKDVDGTWEGELLTPGADIGGLYDKRVNVRLVFSRNGTTLLLRDDQQRPWVRIGDDPVQAKRKTNLVVRVRAQDSRDPRGHQIVFSRLRESSAHVIYSRGQFDPGPGGKLSIEDMRAGAVAREGSPVPTGLAAELWNVCLNKVHRVHHRSTKHQRGVALRIGRLDGRHHFLNGMRSRGRAESRRWISGRSTDGLCGRCRRRWSTRLSQYSSFPVRRARQFSDSARHRLARQPARFGTPTHRGTRIVPGDRRTRPVYPPPSPRRRVRPGQEKST